MTFLLPRRTLGFKLSLAFAGVLVVMLAALGLVLMKASAASHSYEEAIAWNAAVEDAARQAAGTRQQQAAQALYAYTGDARYKREWEQGVQISDEAVKTVEALHDPEITKIAEAVADADAKHDQVVTKQLFPAVAAGDTAAAGAALKLADRYVREPLRAQEEIAVYVSRQQKKDVEEAKADDAEARDMGIIAGLLATLLAVAIVAFVSRGIRRTARDVQARLSDLERNAAVALQDALGAIAAGDLTNERPIGGGALVIARESRASRSGSGAARLSVCRRRRA
jgi:CHASE3 domain sensor protein